MRLLLTGAGGFIGRNLKEHLAHSHTILSPRSAELDLLNAAASRDYFATHPVDFIIHCAARGGVRGVADAATVESDNLLMFQNLLRYKPATARMIIFGSGAQYDRQRDLANVPESELGKHIPRELYGRAKMRMAQQALQRDDVLCLVIFGCYGRYEKQSRFPTYSVLQNLRRQPITINQNVFFDYLYITDLCRITEHFLDRWPSSKVINITPDKSISLLELAEIVNEASGFESPIHVVNPEFNFQYTGENALLHEELPGLHFTEYRTGIIGLRSTLAP